MDTDDVPTVPEAAFTRWEAGELSTRAAATVITEELITRI